MANYIEEDVLNSIIVAQKLKEIGEIELCKEFCVNIVKQVSLKNDRDVLELFYGCAVYDYIQDPSDALKYIFMSKCAYEVYGLISSLSSANFGSVSWAKTDGASSNKKMIDFFNWLQKSNRRIEEGDVKIFKKVISAMNNPERVFFRMSDVVANMTLVEIISGVVNGNISLTSSGELR